VDNFFSSKLDFENPKYNSLEIQNQQYIATLQS